MKKGSEIRVGRPLHGPCERSQLLPSRPGTHGRAQWVLWPSLQCSRPVAGAELFLSEPSASFQCAGDEGAVPQTWGEVQRPAYELQPLSDQVLARDKAADSHERRGESGRSLRGKR